MRAEPGRPKEPGVAASGRGQSAFEGPAGRSRPCSPNGSGSVRAAAGVAARPLLSSHSCSSRLGCVGPGAALGVSLCCVLPFGLNSVPAVGELAVLLRGAPMPVFLFVRSKQISPLMLVGAARQKPTRMPARSPWAHTALSPQSSSPWGWLCQPCSLTLLQM